MDTNKAMDQLEDVNETVGRMSDAARVKLSEVSNRVKERSRVAATTTDAYVHEYAWSSVALAALLGVVIGLMIRKS